MKFLFSFITTVLMIQALSADEEHHSLDQAWNTLTEFVNNATSRLQQELTPTDETYQTLQNNAQTLASKFQEFAQSLVDQSHTASSNISHVLTSVSETINNAASQLQQHFPNVGTGGIPDIQEQLRTGLETAKEEVKKLRDSLQGPADNVHDTLARTSEEFANRVRTFTENLQHQLEGHSAQ